MDTKNETGARENKCNDQDRPQAMGGTRQESPILGNEPHGINFTGGSGRNSQREDFNYIDSEGNFGKILGQLREIEESHLAYVGAHKKRLETRLNDAEEHERKFKNQVEAVEQQILSLMESLKA